MFSTSTSIILPCFSHSFDSTMAILEYILHAAFFPFLSTRGVVLPRGIPFLVEQGTPHLDHNDRSSPTGCLELEGPFLKPCMMGYFMCVCVCQLDYLQTVMPPCHTLVPPCLDIPQLPFTKSSCRPLGLLYLPEVLLWMDWGGRVSVSFYFGPVACERDSYCYCCEGPFSVRGAWHCNCNQLSQHRDC